MTNNKIEGYQELGDDFENSFEWRREPRVVMLTLSYRINNFKSDERGDRGGGMDFGGGGEY